MGQHGLVLEQMRREYTRKTNERAVGKPLVWDLAFQKSSTVRLNVCLETLFRAPTLGLSSMAVKEGQEGGEAYEK